MNKNIFVCATDITVITGANPYKDIEEIYLKYWKKFFKEDYLSIYNELINSQIPLKQEETYYECVKRIAKESNVNIYHELGSCMSTKNTDDLNLEKKKLMAKIKDKIPESKKEEFTKSFNSLTNTNFGIKYENKGVELYIEKTKNSVEFDRKYHKKVLFEIPAEKDNSIDTWHLGGKLDGLVLDKDNNQYVLEIKNRVNRLFYSLKEYEKVQCYVYMYLMGIEKTHLTETMKSKKDNSINIIEIEFEAEYWEMIIEKTMEFIEDFYKFINDKNRKIELLVN
jgi:hypothetical protein